MKRAAERARWEAGRAEREAGRAERLARGQGTRQQYTAAVRAGMIAGNRATEAERELAGRAGEPCPVCRRPVGRTGMCYRSAACFDDGISRVMTKYDPAELYKGDAKAPRADAFW